MRLLSFFILGTFVTNTQAAVSGSIVQVTHRLRMTRSEPKAPREYFVDVGLRDGLKAGDVLRVTRQLPVANGVTGGPWQVLRVVIGDLQVLWVGENSSLGRVKKILPKDQLPTLDYEQFMIGDMVEMSSSLPTPPQTF